MDDLIASLTSLITRPELETEPATATIFIGLRKRDFTPLIRILERNRDDTWRAALDFVVEELEAKGEVGTAERGEAMVLRRHIMAFLRDA